MMPINPPFRQSDIQHIAPNMPPSNMMTGNFVMQGQYNPGFGVNRVIHKQTPHPPINN
jgi:hypothetical protein